MGIGVQREAGVGVAQDARQGLGIHAAGQGMGGEGMAEIVEADVWQARAPEDILQPLVGGARRDRQMRIAQAREDPLGGIAFVPLL